MSLWGRGIPPYSTPVTVRRPENCRTEGGRYRTVCYGVGTARRRGWRTPRPVLRHVVVPYRFVPCPVTSPPSDRCWHMPNTTPSRLMTEPPVVYRGDPRIRSEPVGGRNEREDGDTTHFGPDGSDTIRPDRNRARGKTPGETAPVSGIRCPIMGGARGSHESAARLIICAVGALVSRIKGAAPVSLATAAQCDAVGRRPPPLDAVAACERPGARENTVQYSGLRPSSSVTTGADVPSSTCSDRVARVWSRMTGRQIGPRPGTVVDSSHQDAMVLFLAREQSRPSDAAVIPARRRGPVFIADA